MKDYDFELSYRHGKANVVADALSRIILHISTLMVKEMDSIEKFIDLSLVCEIMTQSMCSGIFVAIRSIG